MCILFLKKLFIFFSQCIIMKSSRFEKDKNVKGKIIEYVESILNWKEK